jgi:hypothetical protein
LPLFQFKELSTWEKFYVTMYNLIEPLLVAFLVSTSIEVVSIGPACYLIIAWGVYVPLLLTQNLFYVKLKYVLAYVLCGLSFADIFMKMWIYIGFTDDITNVKSKETWMLALGVYPDQWTKTFLNDIMVFVFSVLCVVYYYFVV